MPKPPPQLNSFFSGAQSITTLSDIITNFDNVDLSSATNSTSVTSDLGNNSLTGDAGDDTVSGGAGNDILNGSYDADIAIFSGI